VKLIAPSSTDHALLEPTSLNTPLTLLVMTTAATTYTTTLHLWTDTGMTLLEIPLDAESTTLLPSWPLVTVPTAYTLDLLETIHVDPGALFTAT